MLYEKKVSEVLGIYDAANNNIPAVDDVKVTFKDDEGTTVELTRESVLKDDKAGGMLLEADGTRTPVKGYAGDKQVIPPASATNEVVEEPPVVAAKKVSKKKVVAEPVTE